MSAVAAFGRFGQPALLKRCTCGAQAVAPLAVVTCIRWRKDPRLPKAPSKLYNVRQPTPRDPAETEFLKKNTDIYRTKCRAIWNFVAEQYADAEKATSTTAQTQYLADLGDALRLNEEWNKAVAHERLLRQGAKTDKRDTLRQDAMLHYELQRENQQKKAADDIHKNMDLAKNLPDLNKLDVEIEKLLSNVKDVSFALDPSSGKLSSGTFSKSNQTSVPSSAETRSRGDRTAA